MEFFDLEGIVRAAGYTGIFGIIFAESGLLLGFFFPGDSLLFTAGFLASQGFLDIAVLVVVSFLAAVLGDSFGYAFGRRLGPMIFVKEDSILFHKNHLVRAKEFYEQHGGKAIILARFMPVIRTFAPILAGVGNMRYREFLSFNVIGGAIWGIGVPLAGFYLGNVVPNVDHYIVPIVLLIILSSIIPPLIHLARNKEDRERAKRALKRIRERKPRI